MDTIPVGIRLSPPGEATGAVQRQRDPTDDQQDGDEEKDYDATSHGLINTPVPAGQTAFATGRQRCPQAM
ncbi:MAG TPA: hypothetical protein VN635_11400 [Conexibacter sp.]|nr:hypothetical protein [Conexibacter sp.]